MEKEILDALRDLHKQATKERSHFYVGRTCERAYIEIERLREETVMMQRLSFDWMKKHDRLLGFIQKRPELLKELIETDSAEHARP